MSTWQLFPDSNGDDFRWEAAGRILHSESNSTVESAAPPLPSMADLLLQGCSKLTERKESTPGEIPMFRTGLGKSVALKESSIARAKSILADDKLSYSDNVLPKESGGFGGVPTTLFQTASNKKVTVSSAGMARAKALLGLEEEDDLNGFKHVNQPFEATAIQHHSVEYEGILNPSLKVPQTKFKTAGGKILSVSTEALKRARNLLGDPELGTFFDDGQFVTPQKDISINNGSANISYEGKTDILNGSSKHTSNSFISPLWSSSKEFGSSGCNLIKKFDEAVDERGCALNVTKLATNGVSNDMAVNNSKEVGFTPKANLFRRPAHQPLGKSVVLKESSIADDKISYSDNVLPKESGGFGGVPSTLFQTASNKKVTVSSAGMARAKALLGLEEEDDLNGLKHVNQPFDATAIHHHSGEYEGILNPSLKVPQTKFKTAGGKSLSVSAEALKRARNLLGDPELGNFFDDGQFVTPQKDIAINNGSANISHEGKTDILNGSNKHTSNSFISPLRSSSEEFRSSGCNLIKKFDATVDERGCALNVTKLDTNGNGMAVNNSKEVGFIPRANLFRRPADQPLVDITNCSDTAYANNRQGSNQKRRLGKTSSVSPFKRPRNSSFVTPLKKNAQLASSGLSVVSSDTLYSKKVLSTRYPERYPRVYIEDYFGMPPTATTNMNYVPDHVKRIKSSNAHRYVFHDEFSSNVIGAETFLQMLARSGASLQHASRKWVTNHYRWIVWKLACYEVYYPAKCRGRFLRVNNVLEELKYRHEREVNHGHCSAIKRILSGDAPASSMMVLCISAINPKTDNDSQETHGPDGGNNLKVELTDGWYSMNAALDVMLTKQLNAGKLFVGQKLRIVGAGLSGWACPTSPLEAVMSNTICLLLNINGTYRAHWADRLGFCKEDVVPLAFNCIKCNGGPVPKTVAGITRIYPVLYKERLGAGKSIVRSERMESRILQMQSQRRTALVEGFVSEYQRGINSVNSQNDTDSDEGAKIFMLLETSAEPEFLMAEMSIEQLTAFSTYKSKLEASRQKNMEKSVGKAMEDAGLCERDVTPFMRIRVVGLSSLSRQGKHNPKEGIVTIWNPTERQKTELTEGKIYIMQGLAPVNSNSETLYLHGRGSSSRWQPLSEKASENFQPFFNPRKSISLLELGEIPFSSEFDIAAYVVYVGDVYTDVQEKKQWVFVTDGSLKCSHSGQILHSLLAISFCTSSMDDFSVPLISHNLVGSVVGFCNVIKRAKDARNEMWVGQATENSVYFINAQDAYSSHLKTTSSHIQTWAKLSSSNSAIHQLRQRVLSIIGA